MDLEQAQAAVDELKSIVANTPASVIAFEGRNRARVEAWFAKADYSVEAHAEMLGAWKALNFDERDFYVFRMHGRVVSKGKWRDFGDLIFHEWIEDPGRMKEIA